MAAFLGHSPPVLPPRTRWRPCWKPPSKKLIQVMSCGGVLIDSGMWRRKEEVVLLNGIRYYEENSEVFVDTLKGDKKPLALVMGSRPYSKGVCEGIEYVLRSMKVGGKRMVIVPLNLGFEEKGTDLGAGVQIPPSASLEYIVEVDKVSTAPA